MFRVILLILFVLVVLAFKFLDWWVLLILGAALILLSKFVAKRLVLWLFSMPFRAKGKVLRMAAVEIHSVRPAATPVRNQVTPQARLAENANDAESEDDEDVSFDESPDDEPDAARNYYEIDVTITPKATTGPFHFWDFSEVTLVKPGKRWDEDDDTCRIENVDLVREGTVLLAAGAKADEDDEGTKVSGPHRLRILVGAKPDVRELVFNYYFEKFGKVRLTDA